MWGRPTSGGMNPSRGGKKIPWAPPLQYDYYIGTLEGLIHMPLMAYRYVQGKVPDSRALKQQDFSQYHVYVQYRSLYM